MFNRFQLNFRNHRKIVVVDGRIALIGGHNVGDEYLGRHSRLTPWRDTHLRIEGPAVLGAQLAFAEDWHWATQSVPNVRWEPQPSSEADKLLFVFPSGPADEYETCGLLFTHAINCATRRIWIASPYFVPDESIIAALKLAAMRGVDVRVLIPGLADKWFIKLAAMSYVAPVTRAGVKMYEYGRGFMHQKVVLIDNDTSIIGTANFDNRSFRLNFEISIIVLDKKFALQAEEMLNNDFANSKLMTAQVIADYPLTRRVGSRIARLFAPVM
jgi:cardiolipin synthase